MYALITQNNEISEIGELQKLFPNEPNPTASYASQNGAKEIIDGNQEDQRFYNVVFASYSVGETYVTRNYVNTPKALEDVTETPVGATEPVTTNGLKSNYIAQFKQTANSMLAQTDWMVIRKAERNVDIPSSVATYRASVVAKATELETAITAVTTVEQLIALDLSFPSDK